MTHSFEVQGIGPVDLVRIDFPDDDAGGVTVIRGRNEAGKSTCLEAIDALITGDASRLEPSNDGPGTGYIRGPGRELKVTSRSARKRAGDDALPLRALAGADLATFIHPGFESDDSNDRARIHELAKLSGTTLTLEDFGRLVHGGAAALRARMKPEHTTLADPVDLGARVKAAVEVAARADEAEEQRHAGSVAELEREAERLGEAIDPAVETRPEVLDAVLRETVRAREAGKARAAEHALAAKRQADARARLDAFRAKVTGPTLAMARAAAHDATKAETAAQEAFEAAAKQADELELALRMAKGAAEARRRESLAASDLQRSTVDQVVAIEQAEQAVAGWQQLADEAVPAGPDEAELDRLEAVERAALDAQALGTEAARAKERLAGVSGQVAEAQKARAIAAQRAKAWRDAAAGVDDVLTEVVRKTGVDGLKVMQGRLLAKNKAGWLPIDKLSGAAAAEVTCRIWFRQAAKLQQAGGPAPKVILRQEAWDGMLAPARNRVIGLARAEGVRLITAEAWNSKLQAVEVGEASDGR